MNICCWPHRYVRELAEHKMIETADGFTMAPTQTGHLISRHYIRFDTMKTLSELTQAATTSDILNKMSYAAEFESASVKHNEKRLLKTLNERVSPTVKLLVGDLLQCFVGSQSM
jgi:ATP-dependent DNA helicase HFM1/MER3